MGYSEGHPTLDALRTREPRQLSADLTRRDGAVYRELGLYSAHMGVVLAHVGIVVLAHAKHNPYHIAYLYWCKSHKSTFRFLFKCPIRECMREQEHLPQRMLQ